MVIIIASAWIFRQSIPNVFLFNIRLNDIKIILCSMGRDTSTSTCFIRRRVDNRFELILKKVSITLYYTIQCSSFLIMTRKLQNEWVTYVPKRETRLCFRHVYVSNKHWDIAQTALSATMPNCLLYNLFIIAFDRKLQVFEVCCRSYEMIRSRW